MDIEVKLRKIERLFDALPAEKVLRQVGRLK
jgi:hypothetical protein